MEDEFEREEFPKEDSQPDSSFNEPINEPDVDFDTPNPNFQTPSPTFSSTPAPTTPSPPLEMGKSSELSEIDRELEE